MQTFFYGWRRKAGVVTLGLSLTLLAGWLRSFALREAVNATWGGGVDHSLCSLNGSLSWTRHASKVKSDRAIRWYSDRHMRGIGHDWWQSSSCQTLWKWQGAGIQLGAATHNYFYHPARVDYWLIPYWLIVLPLAILSAYLLLIPSRKRQPTASRSDA